MRDYQAQILTLDDLVPADDFMRKLDANLDLTFVYAETHKLYSHRYGRPPIDPVILVKYLLMGYLYGIPSEREIARRIARENPLRWYLGLDFFDSVPDHSTISQLRRRKPAFRKVFRRLFEEVMGQCIAIGLVRGRLVGTDSTHVKACASRASEELVELPVEPSVYWERLDAYEEIALETLAEKTGKRRGKRMKQIKKDSRRSHKRVSRTDSEAGHMKRPGKPEGQYYLSHQTLDCDHGVILDVTVTPGDIHDSVPYLEQLEHIHKNVVPIQSATADSAYDFPLAHQVLDELSIRFFVRPQTIHPTTQVEFGRELFRYDEQQDCYFCPNGKALELHGVGRSASAVTWKYLAKRSDCQSCPDKDRCLSRSHRNWGRMLERSVFHETVQRDLARQNEAEYLDALRKRQIWCEGTFAAQKWGHNLTRILRRGLEAAEDHCLLSATALNLKRMIKCMGGAVRRLFSRPVHTSDGILALCQQLHTVQKS